MVNEFRIWVAAALILILLSLQLFERLFFCYYFSDPEADDQGEDNNASRHKG